MLKIRLFIILLVCTIFFSGCNVKKENTSSLNAISNVSSGTISSAWASSFSASSAVSTVSSSFVDSSPLIENDSSGIPDKVFYGAILAELNKSPNEKFTQNEALAVTSLVFGQEFYKEKIKNINGIGYLRNVTFLHLANNEIVDLSPVLALKNLKNLNLSYNRIEDISSLSKLNGVEILNLAYNNIKDISPIANAKGLKELYLWYNSIADISPLLSLSTLRTVNLESNYLNMSDEKTVSNVNTLKSRIKYFSIGVQGVKKGDIRKAPLYLYIGKQQELSEQKNVYYTKATLDGAEIELNKLYELTEPKRYQVFLWDNTGTHYGIAFNIEKSN